MGAGVRDAFPPPICCVVVFIHLRMETPLCGRSGGHIGTAPTVSFGQIAGGRLMSFGGIVCRWLISFVWAMCVNIVTPRGRMVAGENLCHRHCTFFKFICVRGNHPFVARGNVSFLMVLDGQNSLKGHAVHCGRWLLHM